MAVLSTKTTLSFLAVFMFMVSGCKKEAAPSNTNLSEPAAVGSPQQANQGTVEETVCFKAIAAVAGCKPGVTENIEFSGLIENRVNRTTVNGTTHYTRHFVVKGLTGKGTMVQH
jgi:hypothetical protein